MKIRMAPIGFGIVVGLCLSTTHAEQFQRDADKGSYALCIEEINRAFDKAGAEQHAAPSTKSQPELTNELRDRFIDQLKSPGGMQGRNPFAGIHIATKIDGLGNVSDPLLPLGDPQVKRVVAELKDASAVAVFYDEKGHLNVTGKKGTMHLDPSSVSCKGDTPEKTLQSLFAERIKKLGSPFKVKTKREIPDFVFSALATPSCPSLPEIGLLAPRAIWKHNEDSNHLLKSPFEKWIKKKQRRATKTNETPAAQDSPTEGSLKADQ